jgi:hypothetical protein
MPEVDRWARAANLNSRHEADTFIETIRELANRMGLKFVPDEAKIESYLMSKKTEVLTEVIEPISFYIRADNGTVEVVALAPGEQRVYRLTELQAIHLASDATLQLTKRVLAERAASIKPK